MSLAQAQTARPYPPESRKLKVAGLVLALSGLAGVGAAADILIVSVSLDAIQLALLAALTLVAGNAIAVGAVLVATGCGAARVLRDPRRRRAVGLQLLLANVLLPVVLFGVMLDRQSADTNLWQDLATLAAALAGYALCLLAWRLWRRSRRFEAIGADEAMALDPRPPVLYLRSFRDDGLSIHAQDGSLLKRRVVEALRLPTPEEHMAKILARVGPLIAIGKPSEPLPELGAARLYVAHDRWQQTVSDLMQRAALVVVRVGASPGVLWEIEQALVQMPRQRLVLVLLGGDPIAPELAARLAPVLGESLQAALAQPPRRSWRSVLLGDTQRRIGGMVCFDAVGQALAVPVRQLPARWPRFDVWSLLRPSAGPLEDAWKQVFAQVNLAWGESRGRRSRLLAVALALTIGWVGAHWFYLGNHRRGWIYIAALPLALVPLFLAYADALRFIWVERAQFEARWVVRRRG